MGVEGERITQVKPHLRMADVGDLLSPNQTGRVGGYSIYDALSETLCLMPTTSTEWLVKACQRGHCLI